MSTLQVETQSKNPVNYRFGQDFTYENIKFAWRRQGYANKLVVGAVDDAIKGFNIIDKKTNKPIGKNDEAIEIINTMWVDIKKSMYYDRAYGKSLGMFWLVEGHELPIWRAYDIRNYFASYDAFAVPFKYVVTNKVGGMAATFNTAEIIDQDLGATYEIIIREDDKKGEGLSAIEPVWDTLFALSTLDEQGTYYAIRYGAGIRYMKIPESKFTDTAFMAKIMGMLKGAIGANGVYALPYATISGVTEEFSMHQESAIQIDFLQLRDLMLGTLSAQTGIPREVLLGSQTGLRSSEKNEDAYFDFLQSIQDDYKTFLKWIVNTLNIMFEWFAENVIIDIDYFRRETMNEEEMVEQIGKKIDIANKAGFNVPREWLADKLGIELEDKAIDPLGINNADNEDTEDEEKEDTEDEEKEDTEQDSESEDEADDTIDEDDEEDE